MCFDTPNVPLRLPNCLYLVIIFFFLLVSNTVLADLQPVSQISEHLTVKAVSSVTFGNLVGSVSPSYLFR